MLGTGLSANAITACFMYHCPCEATDCHHHVPLPAETRPAFQRFYVGPALQLSCQQDAALPIC
jgi:hypothetical protein